MQEKIWLEPVQIGGEINAWQYDGTYDAGRRRNGI